MPHQGLRPLTPLAQLAVQQLAPGAGGVTRAAASPAGQDILGQLGTAAQGVPGALAGFAQPQPGQPPPPAQVPGQIAQQAPEGIFSDPAARRRLLQDIGLGLLGAATAPPERIDLGNGFIAFRRRGIGETLVPTIAGAVQRERARGFQLAKEERGEERQARREERAEVRQEERDRRLRIQAEARSREAAGLKLSGEQKREKKRLLVEGKRIVRQEVERSETSRRDLIERMGLSGLNPEDFGIKLKTDEERARFAAAKVQGERKQKSLESLLKARERKPVTEGIPKADARLFIDNLNLAIKTARAQSNFGERGQEMVEVMIPRSPGLSSSLMTALVSDLVAGRKTREEVIRIVEESGNLPEGTEIPGLTTAVPLPSVRAGLPARRLGTAPVSASKIIEEARALGRREK